MAAPYDWAMMPEAASGNMHSTWLRSMSWPWPVRFLCSSAAMRAAPALKPPLGSPPATWFMVGGQPSSPVMLGRPEPCSSVEP